MSRRRAPVVVATPLTPTGVSTSPDEIVRCDAERQADLRAERRLLAAEMLIIATIAGGLAVLQGIMA